jgi:glucose-6-phosphate 1-dehydrogenase
MPFYTHIIYATSLNDEKFNEIENMMETLKKMHDLKSIRIAYILTPRPNVYEIVFEGIKKEKKDKEE